MKKKKKSLKKLTLNKKVVSNLEGNQVSGGTLVTVFCPTALNCPTRFNCPTFGACPTLRIDCVKTLDSGCIRTIDCSFAGCPSGFIC
ncbi:hypothetical protein IMCC3317_33170 [Kordia antarctica]|uniref:Uncharacterized protein n=1 Tax=Kordia antarctica TaxID=1218801 RepID=A0A7L4ZPY7_9FLAO|nr:class I lanthipeptide [Kordia antarctica]QHI37934.1 hypothetical protein IMCC3317_33170 [Kordia antarctica]